MTESKQGKGFALRLVVLVGILAVAVGVFYYDRFVLPEKNKVAIEAAYQLMVADDTEGDGISKSEVAAAIGFAPQSETSQDDYVIEKYEFKRALPFLQGEYLNVIYQNGSLVKIIQNKEFDPKDVDNSMGIRPPDPAKYKGQNVEIGVAGGGGDEADEDEDKDDDSKEGGEDEEASEEPGDQEGAGDEDKDS